MSAVLMVCVMVGLKVGSTVDSKVGHLGANLADMLAGQLVAWKEL